MKAKNLLFLAVITISVGLFFIITPSLYGFSLILSKIGQTCITLGVYILVIRGYQIAEFKKVKQKILYNFMVALISILSILYIIHLFL